jgi:hypothetical protein
MTGTVVTTTVVPCADMCLRGSPERSVGQTEMTSLIIGIAPVLLTIDFGRIPLIDFPLSLALCRSARG